MPFLGGDLGEEIRALEQRLPEGGGETVLGGRFLPDRQHDLEEVDRDVVLAREGTTGSDVDARDGEGARHAAEETGAVPSHDGHERLARAGVVMPLDDGAQGLVRVGRGDRGDQTMDHPEMMRGVLRGGVQVIARRHRGEVRLDLVLRDVGAEQGDRLRAQLRGGVGVLVVVDGVGEAGERAAVERPVLAILEVGPEVGRRGACVAAGVREEAAQDLLVAHQPGEAIDVGGVVDVVTLPVESHHEVVADDAGRDLALPGVETEPLEDAVRDRHAALGMAFDAAGLGDVVQEQDGVKQRRRLGTEHDLAVFLLHQRLAGVDAVEFTQAAQGMYVGRPAMVELELHQAVQARELRDEPVQEAVLTQGVERRIDATAFGQHGAQGAAGFLRQGDLGREQVGAFADQQGERPVRAGLMDLADAEQPDQTAGIFLEEQAVLGRHGAARDDAQSVHDERSAPPFGLGFAHDRAFDDLGAPAHMVRGVEILAHHAADAFGQTAGEAQGGRHGVLPFQRELLGRSRDLEVEFATQAQEHLLGLLELLQVDRRQEAGRGETGRADAIACRPGDPNAPLDVAEGADAVLEVGLLQVGAAPGFLATLALRLDDLPGERLPRLPREQGGRLGFELGVELGRAAQVTRLEQGHVQMKVVLREVGRLGDRPDRLPDLQAEIPERIQDRLDEGLGRGGVTRHEHQQVDVAERTKFGAAITARGDQTERGRGRSGAEEQGVEQDVDGVGTQAGDFAAADAGAMRRQLELAGLGQEDLGARDELAFQGRLPGQTVLESGAAEQDGGGFVFGRHATMPTWWERLRRSRVIAIPWRSAYAMAWNPG